MEKLRQTVTKTFRLNGYAIQSEAATYLCGILEPIGEDNQRLIWLDKIIDKVQKQPLTNTLIKREIVELAVKECGKGDDFEPNDIMAFLNAFDFPQLDYDRTRSKFIQSEHHNALITAAVNKPQLFQNRYTLLMQRTLHHKLFAPTGLGLDGENKTTFDLKVIEYLAGCTSKVGDIIVLGMITQLKEGKYYLEDPTGSVQMDLSATKFHHGLFTENCFVLAEGTYDDGIFYANTIGLPPPESAKATRSYYVNTDFFGARSNLNRQRLLQIEAENEEAMFLFLAEVHLDNKTVRDKLRALLSGYEDSPPVAIVLMGNFLSQPHGVQSCLDLRKAFQDLADIIIEFPNLAKNSKFVMIPGPGDPGFVNILPRPPFADVMVEYLKEKVPNTVFMSNPCRIRYCTKEIIVFREDVMAKMCRNSIYFPTTGNVPTHFVKTLIGQAHLCPLPLHVCPIYWSYDHSLTLYPLPDLVVIGDRCDPFTENFVENDENQGVLFVNPGSFVKTEFSFKAYSPFENKVDDCQLPGDDE